MPTTNTINIDYTDFPFEKIPRRIFLDTNVVDCMVKWGDCIFEQQEPPAGLHAKLVSDITSLMHIFHVGSRANWDVVISSKTISELSQTSDEMLRNRLVQYGAELARYVANNGITEDDHKYASDLARRLVDSRFLAPLPDTSDRELISHAVALGCDTFCTRDLRSIHRKRQQLRSFSLHILTPAEWWRHIRPWAALWL